MMIKPGITELDRCVDSRYTLVSMVAKRARMIGKERHEEDENGAEGYDTTLSKPVTQAVDEISKGIVGYVRSEAIERAREYEQEKINAISHFEKDKTSESKDDADADPFDDSDELNAVDAAINAANDAEADDSEF